MQNRISTFDVGGYKRIKGFWLFLRFALHTPPYHESLAGALGIPELMPPIRRRDFQGKKYLVKMGGNAART